ADQEPVSGAIDLYEAMARALKYNLDHKVEVFDTVVKTAELNAAHYDMLPGLAVSAGYGGRDNYDASSSFNLITRTPNFGASTSQERQSVVAEAALSWNILDFGLSYVRAQQSANKVLIAAETRRKIANRIIEDVRTAYWRALAADRLIRKLNVLEARTRAALANTDKISTEGQASPVTALTYQRELLEVRRTVQELQRDLTVAKQQLAALMNLQPGENFRLVAPNRAASLRAPGKVRAMIWTALQHRPELRELEYQKRINMREADAALLSMLPGIQLYAGPNFDSNDFLLNNNWMGWGAKASGNLLKLLKYPAQKEVIDKQGELLDQRGLAITMAIMTQVHVSNIRFRHLQKELGSATQYYDVQRRLLDQMKTQTAAERISEQTLIREEMNTLLAELRRDITYSSLQNAYANLYASMGMDGYVDEIDFQAPVKDLSRSLAKLW
ncbi:TolC family protein, partial [Bosea sp. CER48]|uniref:TolC family protein n=1 Tax=Bosea sp. CER48 TaxID=3377035 RepID=UPI00382EB91B